MMRCAPTSRPRRRSASTARGSIRRSRTRAGSTGRTGSAFWSGMRCRASRSTAARRSGGWRPSGPRACDATATIPPGSPSGGGPLLVGECGGRKMSGWGGWGYAQVGDAAQLLQVYRGLIEGLMEPGPVEGFCYTQLTDVEQEQNGLLTYDRRPKLDAALVKPITQTAKRR